MESHEVDALAQAVYQKLLDSSSTLALAESCSGGNLAAALTKYPGVSEVFLGSIVCYSNAMKQKLLGVSSMTLDTNGAVSEQAVDQMLKGLLKQTEAKYALATSGVAGPDGGTEQKPVGTVYIGVAKRDQPPVIQRHLFLGDRSLITLATCSKAFSMLLEELGEQ